MSTRRCKQLVSGTFLLIGCFLSAREAKANFQLPNGRWYWDLATSGSVAKADDICNHKFTILGKTFAFGEDINWKTNPFPPTEWMWQFNRHGWMSDLGAVYHQTQDEKYAREWINEILDWTADCAPSWPRGIEVGIRCTKWIPAWFHFSVQNNSASISSSDRTAFLNSLKEQAVVLDALDTPGNHGMIEQHALFSIAVLFPEFANSATWEKNSISKLQVLMKAQYLSDGGYAEIGYPAMELFINTYDLALMNSSVVTLPDGFIDPLEKAMIYTMFYSKPNKVIGGWGDGGGDMSGFLKKGSILFNRQDMQFVSSAGTTGTPPAETSKLFPVTGHAFMRSSWGTGSDFDRQLWLGFVSNGNNRWQWHSHIDWLDIEVFGYGKDLITETGKTVDSYQIEAERYLALQTAAHNTIRVDNKDQVNIINSVNHSLGPLPTYGIKEWVSNNGFDFAHGWLQSRNYPVMHERKVFFVRDEYWIISDLLTSTDKESHRYEQYFHLPKTFATASNVTLHSASKAVICSGNNLTIMPADPAQFTSAELATFDMPEDILDETRSKRFVRYTKTGPAPVTFDTVIYPDPIAVPSLTLTRLPVNNGSIEAHKASGLRIEIGNNEDYYLIAHDRSTTTTYDYGTYRMNGEIGYIRKDASGKIVNIQMNSGTELTDNGVLIARTDKKSSVGSKGGAVEIWGEEGASVTNYQVWCPAATSVKINGVSVGVQQYGNYVANGIDDTCQEDRDCDDGDKCTADYCIGNLCERQSLCCRDDTECNDQEPCTIDHCDDGKCVGEPVGGCCHEDSECDDADSCTADRCDETNRCQHEAVGGCGDGGKGDGGEEHEEIVGGCGCGQTVSGAWIAVFVLAGLWRWRGRTKSLLERPFEWVCCLVAMISLTGCSGGVISGDNDRDCGGSWQCEQPLNGNENDGCGNRRLSPACDALSLCGNGVADPGEACDRNGDIGCGGSTPVCEPDCSGCNGGKEDCTEARCTELGKDCGELLVDGCGVIQCGDCAAAEKCGGGGTPNVCGAEACSWECEQPLNGFEKDGCGNRRPNPACDVPNPCGNGEMEAGEACDTNGNVGCGGSTPVCKEDCSQCLEQPKELLFDGSFRKSDKWTSVNGPFGVWTGYSCVPQPDSLVVVPASDLPGGRTGYAGRFTTRPTSAYDCGGNQHNQITIPTPKIPAAASEVWYGWSQMQDASWKNDAGAYGIGFAESYAIACPTCAGSGLKFSSYGNRNQLQLDNNCQGVSTSDCSWLIDTEYAMQPGVWEDWMFHVKWSRDDTGFVEVYKNGQRIWERYGYATRTELYDWYYHRIGIYRSSKATTTQILYIMNAKIGTTREAVEYKR